PRPLLPTKLACNCRPSCGLPFGSWACTSITVCAPSWRIVVVRLLLLALGTIHCTICAAKRGNSDHVIQSLAHLPFVSLVHATARPKPYCHWASTGDCSTPTS